jgi:uncharacterized protein
MKKLYFYTSLLLLFVACNSRAQQPNTTANDDKSLLWRISKQGTKTSYLFGTIHVICKDDYIWTESMKKAYNSSEHVCFEMNLSDPSLMMQAAMGMMDTTGKKLKDYFSADQYALLTQYIKDSLGLDIAMFEQMKPVALTTLFATKGSSCKDPVSYEEKLMEAAKNDKKQIEGLEQLHEQMTLLDKIPIDSMIGDMVADLKGESKQNSEDDYPQMIAAYKQQDLPKLYKMIKDSKDMANMLDAFLDERNKRWIARMKEKMSHTSVFFAVGAGHLWGDNGVISLLKKEGYTVTAVK